MPSLENYVQKIHKKLNNEGLEEHKIKKYLQELDRIQITLDVLKVTGIGRAVNRYRKHGSEYIGDLASNLVTKWKDLLKQEVPSPSNKSLSSKGDNNSIFHLNSNHSNHIGKDSANIYSTPSAGEVKMDHISYKHVKSRHKTSEIKAKLTTPFSSNEEMDHIRNKHMKSKHETGKNKSNVTTPLASNEEMDHIHNKHMKSKYETDKNKSSVTTPLASNEEMDHIHNKHMKSEYETGKNKSNVTTPLASNEEMDRIHNKHMKSKYETDKNKSSVTTPLASNEEMDHIHNKHMKSKYETGKNKSNVTTPLASNEEMDHIHNKHMKSKHETGENKSNVITSLARNEEMDHIHNKHMKSKHETGKNKSNVTIPLASDEEMVQAKKKHVKSKHKTGEIKSNMTTPLASDEEMDHAKKKDVKSKHKTDKIKSNRTTPSASDEEMDHINNKPVKSKNKADEIKAKVRSAPQLCDVSFGCEPVNVKQKKRPTSSASAAMATKMSSSDSVRPELELPPLPSSLSVNKSLLPEIQPTYKPIRMPGYGDISPKKKKGVFGGELDENAVMSRKSRTQVFSGRKLAAHGGVVTSLFESCMKVLIENIDALDDTGGVPYEILQPVLEKCNPQQLLHLEECNPYFTEDTEPLWEKHCCREFKGTKPERNHTWRELYMNNEQEREARLKKINEKIAASQAAKKPERQVKLAYVTTEAKPPPAVRRKQAKFGTGTGIHPSLPVTTPSRSVPQAHHRNVGPSPAKKQAVSAPMMKKTMKLFKNQRSRATTSIRRT